MGRKERRGVKLCERPRCESVGLAEIRLNCWLREKISSVGVVGDALYNRAQLVRLFTASSIPLEDTSMRFTELRNYGHRVD